MSKIPFTERGRQHRRLQEHLRRLMLQRAIKRLPVVDAQGKLKGIINRDSLLRSGFASDSAPSA